MKKFNLATWIVLTVVAILMIIKLTEREVDQMVTYISKKIEEAGQISETKGQAKYKAYFSGRAKQKLYGEYQEDVDTVLETDGFEFCIVHD